MGIDNTVDVLARRRQRYLNDFSSLRLPAHSRRLLSGLNDKLMRFVIVLDIDAKLSVRLVVDVEDQSQSLQCYVHIRFLEGDLDVLIPDDHERFLEKGHLVASGCH